LRPGLMSVWGRRRIQENWLTPRPNIGGSEWHFDPMHRQPVSLTGR
jgi:hypothetical protein